MDPGPCESSSLLSVARLRQPITSGEMQDGYYAAFASVFLLLPIYCVDGSDRDAGHLAEFLAEVQPSDASGATRRSRHAAAGSAVTVRIGARFPHLRDRGQDTAGRVPVSVPGLARAALSVRPLPAAPTAVGSPLRSGCGRRATRSFSPTHLAAEAVTFGGNGETGAAQSTPGRSVGTGRGGSRAGPVAIISGRDRQIKPCSAVLPLDLVDDLFGPLRNTGIRSGPPITATRSPRSPPG
jgi:hypothetical protein